MTSSDSPPDDDKVLGTRLTELRERLGLSQTQVIARSEELAPRLGPQYRAFERTQLSAYENGRLRTAFDRIRAVFAAIYGLTRDELAWYLDGRIDLGEVIRLRAARPASDAPPVTPRGIQRYGEHERWAELCDAARSLDPELTDETLADLAQAPLIGGPLERLDAPMLAQSARALQSWKKRAGRTT